MIQLKHPIDFIVLDMFQLNDPLVRKPMSLIFKISHILIRNRVAKVIMLDPYTTHATPILLLCAPYKPTTVIVVPLH